MRPERSFELAHEHVEDVDRKLAHFRERWDQRFVFERPRFVERYFDGDIQVHVHFKRDRALKIEDEYCARFQFDALSRDWNGDHQRGEQAVFVDDVQLVEHGKERTPAVVRGVVRLQSFDECCGGIAHAAHMDAQFGFVALIGLHDYRELRLRFSRRLGINAFVGWGGKHELIEQHVKACAQMVNDLTSKNTTSQRHGFDRFEDKPDVGGIVIGLTANSVRATICEPNQLGLEITDVLVGPLYTFPTAIK